MNNVSNYIYDSLNDDMACHALLVQCVKDESRRDGQQLSWKDILEELLSHDVEIGTAELKTTEYIEFIAWRGSISERISRAVECVNKAVSSDKEFAYWLCLRKNVDHYE